jgi:hypothetical protein
MLPKSNGRCPHP